jgi:hypothetical protein
MEQSGYANLARPIRGDVRPFRMKAMAGSIGQDFAVCILLTPLTARHSGLQARMRDAV